MIISPGVLKWLLRFYPPLFFQRILVKKFEPDFSGARVEIRKSILNINYNKSIFGGTIFSAADPFYAVCWHQILLRKGYKVLIWTKSSQINFIKPATTSLYFSITLSHTEIITCLDELDNVGKFVKSYPLEMVNKQGEICATVVSEVYIRKIDQV